MGNKHIWRDGGGTGGGGERAGRVNVENSEKGFEPKEIKIPEKIKQD